VDFLRTHLFDLSSMIKVWKNTICANQFFFFKTEILYFICWVIRARKNTSVWILVHFKIVKRLNRLCRRTQLIFVFSEAVITRIRVFKISFFDTFGAYLVFWHLNQYFLIRIYNYIDSNVKTLSMLQMYQRTRS
jgi:hypothetical protein